ncbi:ThiF family adenylyltransferase [Deinococcus alpinitundrae]|uniref:ThiF family adenylyltransferase n=1 Tax=Deinococcus alpinitundrae TaxID=468913 RepID=UPI0013795434|nr:ThiF family adenylyltransferase [Deinococcus alpinitundrae]
MRVGQRYLRVSGALYRALSDLQNSSYALNAQGTQAQLEKSLSPKDAEKIRVRLWSLLHEETQQLGGWRQWLDGFVRWPLWRPEASWAQRWQGRVLPLWLTLWSLSFIGSGLSFFLPAAAHWATVSDGIQVSEAFIVWLMMLVALAIHEAGHVLLAYQHGVPVKEIGIGLLYFQPAAYADVSASRLASKRVRIIIALAGIWFQTLPLMLGFIFWRITGSTIWELFTLLNLLSMGFSMLPFVRTDAYWVLTHLTGEHNLRSRAFDELRHQLWPQRYRAIWSGAAGVLGSLYAALSLCFTLGLYGLIVWWGAQYIPAPFRFVSGLLFATGTLAYIIWWLVRPPVNVNAPVSLPGPLYLNPYRLRMVLEEKIFLGAPYLGRSTALTSTLRKVLDYSSAEPVTTTLSDLDVKLRAHLEHHQFVLPKRLDTQGRFSRQIGFFSLWPGDPEQRQSTLAGKTVCVLGLGTLGAHTCQLLAGAGVGRLIVCDFDIVEPSNFNRQFLYQWNDIGRSKVQAACERLLQLTPGLQIQAYELNLQTYEQLLSVIQGADLVVKAIDHPASVAWLIDQACRQLKIPHIGGGFVENWTVAGPLIMPDGPCLECLLPQQQHEILGHRANAVFGPAAYWLASHIAGDALRYLTGLQAPWLTGRLRILDPYTGEERIQILESPLMPCQHPTSRENNSTAK